MRLAVFIFSLILIVSPIYAHAFAFVPAITGAIVRSGAGQFVKVQSKKALASFSTTKFAKNTLITVATGYCLKNPKKCKDWVGDAIEYFFEDDNTENSYKGLLFETMQGYKKAYGNPHDMCHHYLSNIYTDVAEVKVDGAKIYGKDSDDFKAGDLVSCIGYVRLNYGYKSDLTGESINGRVIKDTQAEQEQQEKETKKQQQAQKIIERIKDDDPDYIINNYGDTINIQQYCSSHACDELTAQFGDEVMKNKHKYDIDKINKINCEVENGKIKSCDNAKRDKDQETDEQQTDDKDTEQGENKDTDDDNNDKNDKKDDKINCEASDFHKKICDFIDWYQDDAELKDGDKVEVKDLSDKLTIDDDKVSFGRACPAGETVSISFAGVFITKQLSYQGLCDAFTKMRPFVIGIGWVVGAMIIGGRRV